MSNTDWSAFESLSFSDWKTLAGPLGESATRTDGLKLPLRMEQIGAEDLVSLPMRAISERNAGNPWQILQTCNHPEQVLEGLLQGVEGIAVDLSDFPMQRWLRGVHLEMVHVHMQGAVSDEDLQWLHVQPNAVHIQGSSLFCVTDESWDSSDATSHIVRLGESLPNLRLWSGDARPWLQKGMPLPSAMSNLCLAMDEMLRGARKNELPLDAWLHKGVWTWEVGGEILVEIAALRALRHLWSRWLNHHGLEPTPIWITAQSAKRLYGLKPKTDHLIGMTASAYASAIGGADGIEVLPHDGHSASVNGLRWARNIQHLMREESGLHGTFDPMQGSYTLEGWTSYLVEEAWNEYRSHAPVDSWNDWVSRGGLRRHTRGSL